jgi:mRNA interferase HigB
MHVISRKRLNEFVARHPDSRPSITNWYRIVKQETFASFADLKLSFPSADRVGKFTVFNISGNKFRLIAAIHYNRRKIYVRSVLTHSEYDLGDWKQS